MYYGELKNRESGGEILKNFSRFNFILPEKTCDGFQFKCKLQYLCFAGSPGKLQQDSTFLS